MELGVRRWQMRLPAVLETPGLARSGMRRWLSTLEWPEDEALDVLLAVNEAVSNAIEHAFVEADTVEQSVEVSGEVEHTAGRRRLRLQVRDNGRWLPRPSHEEYVNRRRGLPIIFAVMAEVQIHRGGQEPAPPPPEAVAFDGHSTEGTVVTLLSPPVPVSEDDRSAGRPHRRPR
ncbi:ATP-binding protein [Pseudonocardia kujensis]|uniref:ATP-binding protein n=1 Tax=Pseudonocardia kujensis TaxID=1128675 RepID=UPI001E5BC024|nr:ATP-binding protein [Pseudonocardia kujensis]MCE0768100.1 ATP-binding protein [Pseudonocardia kujensis]